MKETLSKIQAAIKDPALLSAMDDQDRKMLMDWLKHAKYNWQLQARKEQLPPPGQWTTILYLQGRGAGKLLDAKTKILTPDRGFVELSEISVGDYVYDERGKPTRVLATFDDTPEVAYRIHFSDGTHIDACSEHQWITWTHRDRKAFLRSEYESGPIPDDWPNWRSKRKADCPTRWLPRDKVENALGMIGSGMSVRSAAWRAGVSRQSLAKFVEAGKWYPATQKVIESDLGPTVKTTQEIVDSFTYGKRGDRNHSIPLASPVEMDEKPLLIDPYVFGYWIGDGSKSSGVITAHKDDQPSLCEAISASGLRYTIPPSSDKTVSIHGLIPLLRDIGSLWTKKIPDDYLFNSIENRLSLLRGLMDSDGYIEEGGKSVEFCSMRRDHADAVLWLARSLGAKPTLTAGRATLNGVDYGEKYRVNWNPFTFNPFRLKRKADRFRVANSQQSRNTHRMLVSYERIEPVPMRCLTVDSPNSLFLAGEALIPTHNTRTGSEMIRHFVQAQGYRAVGLIAATASDARDTMIDGKGGSSLLEITPESEKLEYFPTKRRLVWGNGAKGNAFSAEEPERLRGPQHDIIWSDELAAWRYLQETWDMAMFGLRLGKHPKHIITTTPKPLKIIRELVSQATPHAEMTPDTKADVVLVRGSTMDNRDNLAPQFLEALIKKYEGTRLGRQELYAEILDDNPNALFSQQRIDDNRVSLSSGSIRRGSKPSFDFVLGQGSERSQSFSTEIKELVIAVDPSMSADTTSDETGIIVAASDKNENMFVIEDLSGIMSPNQWGEAVVRAYFKYGADCVVAEVNQGGDLVENVIRQAEKELGMGRVTYKKVRASKGKASRAEPVGQLEEQKRIFHVGDFPKLEEQLTTFQPGYQKSPDRLDAYVWAAHHLITQNEQKGFFIF